MVVPAGATVADATNIGGPLYGVAAWAGKKSASNVTVTIVATRAPSRPRPFSGVGRSGPRRGPSICAGGRGWRVNVGASGEGPMDRTATVDVDRADIRDSRKYPK